MMTRLRWWPWGWGWPEADLQRGCFSFDPIPEKENFVVQYKDGFCWSYQFDQNFAIAFFSFVPVDREMEEDIDQVLFETKQKMPQQLDILNVCFLWCWKIVLVLPPALISIKSTIKRHWNVSQTQYLEGSVTGASMEQQSPGEEVG